MYEFDIDILDDIAEFYGCEPSEVSEYYDNGDIIIWYECNDMSDVAWEYVHEVFNCEELVYIYFDYDKFGNDLDIEGYFIADGNGNIVELR